MKYPRRARRVHPSIFEDEQLASLGLAAFRVYIGLSTLADRNGIITCNHRAIKNRLLAFNRGDIEIILQNLHDNNYITIYDEGGIKYIYLNDFKKHQTPFPDEKGELPLPKELVKYSQSTCKPLIKDLQSSSSLPFYLSTSLPESSVVVTTLKNSNSAPAREAPAVPATTLANYLENIEQQQPLSFDRFELNTFEFQQLKNSFPEGSTHEFIIQVLMFIDDGMKRAGNRYSTRPLAYLIPIIPDRIRKFRAKESAAPAVQDLSQFFKDGVQA